MRFEAVDDRLGQMTAGATDEIVAAIRGPGLQPRDTRIRTTWELLLSRGLLHQDVWMRWMLRRMWATGLPPEYRPRTAVCPSGYRNVVVQAGSAGAPSRTASRRCQRADLAAVNGSLR